MCLVTKKRLSKLNFYKKNERPENEETGEKKTRKICGNVNFLKSFKNISVDQTSSNFVYIKIALNVLFSKSEDCSKLCIFFLFKFFENYSKSCH